MIGKGPDCLECKHFERVRMVWPDPARGVCAAFPDGIPVDVWQSEKDHREPYAGDSGIHFEPREAAS